MCKNKTLCALRLYACFVFAHCIDGFLRYRVLLEGVLANTGSELIDTLKLFIEASKLHEKSFVLIILIAYEFCYSCQ